MNPDTAPPEPVVDVTLSGVAPSECAAAIVGDSLSFAVMVINAGTVAAAPLLSLYLGNDETPVKSISIAEIAPGDSVTQDSYVGHVRPGSRPVHTQDGCHHAR